PLVRALPWTLAAYALTVSSWQVLHSTRGGGAAWGSSLIPAGQSVQASPSGAVPRRPDSWPARQSAASPPRAAASAPRAAPTPRGAVEAEVLEHVGVRLLHRQDRVACVAVLGDRAAVRRLVVLVVTAEAAEEVLVPDVVRVRPPGHLHLGKNVAPVNRGHLLG